MKEVFFATNGRKTHLLSLEDIETRGRGLFRALHQERWLTKLYFKDPLEVLHHIRATGALGFLSAGWSPSWLKTWQKRYSALKETEGLPLTYEPILLIWEKV